MRQQAKEWVGFLIGILVAVSSLPTVAGLVGLWITFFQPPYDLSQSRAWQAAWDVPRDQIYFYGIRLIWQVVPISLFLTGLILLLYTNKRKVQWLAVALMVIGWLAWWVDWNFTAITVMALLALIAAFVYGLGYALWSASGNPRQEGEDQEREDAGTPLPTGILISLGALYVALIAYAVLRATTIPVYLDYLVNKNEPKVVGQVTGLSEDGWWVFACKGNAESSRVKVYITRPLHDTIGAYTPTPKRDFYQRIPAMTKKEFDKKVGERVHQDPQSFPLSVFNPHVPEQHADLCTINDYYLELLLGKRRPPIPPASPYESGHFP